MRPCFAFANIHAGDDKPATLSIYDEIGFWGVQAKDFIRDLGAVKSKVLNVEINSPGGDVFAGLAIYNALKGSGKEIVVKVMGVAASAASLIAMAGDKIVMPKNTFLMVHNPWSFAMGNADELRETADTLDKIGSSLLQTYVARTGKSEDEISALLAKDTWMTADEALEMGFATEVVDDVKANAKFDMARADLPENVRAVFLALQAPKAEVEPEPEPVAPAAPADPALADQIDAAAQAAQVGEFAAHFATSCETLVQAQERITQAREIKALCMVAKQPEMAAPAIREGKSVADVRTALVTALAQADEKTHTDTTINSKTTGTSAQPTVSSQSIWAAHNARK